MKKFKKKRKVNYVLLSFILVIIITINMYLYITGNMSNKVQGIIKEELKYINNNLIMNYIELNDIGNGKLNDTINLVKDKNDNIVALDYNMNLTYKILSESVYIIKSGYKDNLIKGVSYTKKDMADGIIVFYPIGLALDNIYLNHFGPEIPVKINYLSSIEVNLKTKVSNYGINNVLVEMYLVVDIMDSIIIPFIRDSQRNSYEILLDAKVLMGNVPSIYGGVLESNSPLFNG